MSRERWSGPATRSRSPKGRLRRFAMRSSLSSRGPLSAESGPPPNLQRYVTSAAATASCRARDQVVRRRGLAPGGRQRRAALFREEASWLVANPFEPPADWWLPPAGPSGSQRSYRRRSSATVPLDPAAATLLRLLGDLLAAGISTAHLRQELQGRAIEWERLRLALEDPRRSGTGPRARDARAGAA